MTQPDQEHHAKVCSIFVAARKLEPDERKAYIDAACGTDADLRRDVEMFLAVNDDDRAALLTNVLDEKFGDFVTDAITGDDAIPESVGRYRIIRKIGEGGMGVVYEAKQENPDRSVALKVIRPGVATPKLIRRFRYEAQVLGRLQHPGVAHIYEAGVSDSGEGMQPFFAMELIQGRPLLEHIKQSHLDTRQRFALLANICDAVEHAHQNGVIHRDLKPANILVTRTGQPKILDFGVARAIDSDVQLTTVQTDVGQLIGTLAYMSPEQVAADPSALDTRSDVYALGVVAYEVLAGRLPYELGNRLIHEAARIIQEEEPTRISVIDRTLRGDVETIVLKALEKDRARRYQSAGALAEDFRRFLKDEPIVARPASALYQVRKFAKRHRTLVAGLVTTFLALVVGLVISMNMYLRAEHARNAEFEQRAIAETARDAEAEQRAIAETARDAETDQRVIAQQEADKANAINKFILKGLLESSNPWKKFSRDVTVAEVLDNLAATAKESFADQPEQEAETRQTLGDTYSASGELEKAVEQFELAIAIRRRLHPSGHDDLAESLLSLSHALNQLGRFDEAEANCRESNKIIDRLHDESDKHVVDGLRALGQILKNKSDYAGAEPLIRKSLSLRRKYFSDDLTAIAVGANQLGALLHALDHHEEAEPLMREALEICLESRPDHPATAGCMSDLAAVVQDLGRSDEALELYRQSVAMYQKHLGPDHHRTMGIKRNLADALRKQGNIDEAEKLLREVVESSERVLGTEHPDTLIALNTLALLLHKSDRIDEAAPIYAKVVEISKASLGPTHRDTLTATYNLAWLYSARKQPEKAEPLFRDVVAGFRDKLGETHSDTLTVTGGLAECLVELEKLPEAETLYRKILQAKRQKLSDNKAGLAKPLNKLADVLVAQKKIDDALSVMTECYEILSSGSFSDHWQTAELRSKIGGCLTALGRTDEAKTSLLESLEALEKNPDAPDRAMAEALKRIIDLFELEGDAEAAELFRARHSKLQND